MQQQFYSQEIFIALLPQQNLKSEIIALSIKLINQTSFPAEYECYFETDKREEKYLANTLNKGAVVQLEGIKFSELNDSPTLKIKITVNKKEVIKLFKFKPKHIANKPEFLQLLQEEAFLFSVWRENSFNDEEETEDDEEEETKPEPLNIDTTLLKEMMMGGKKPTATKIIHETTESNKIDLHVEAIDPSLEKLPAAEILTIQMNLFKQTLERAIASGHHSLIAIHGVGDGILKKQIINYCNHHPRVRECTEPLVNKYGAGATEIHFK